jgi:hypothetical protein
MAAGRSESYGHSTTYRSESNRRRGVALRDSFGVRIESLKRAFRDNRTMKSSRWLRKLAAAAALCFVALAQSPRPGESSVELQPSLFVQLPGGKSIPGAVQLVWIPEPLEKYCLGKTHEQCASMDFCNSHHDQERPRVPKPGRGPGALAGLSA